MKTILYFFLAVVLYLFTVTLLTHSSPQSPLVSFSNFPAYPARQGQQSTLEERLADALPLVQELKSIGGSVGVSIGVLQGGNVIFDKHIGYADVEHGVLANASTRYPLGSLTKSFVAATVAHLIDGESNLTSWDSSVAQHVPDLKLQNAQGPVSLIDIMSHRTGLSTIDELWLGAHGETLVRKNSTVNVCSHLQPLVPVRSKFIYNNWMYALAGELIELVDHSDRSWGDVLTELVLQPLGLNETTVRASDLKGIQEAKPYMVLPDKTPVLVKHMPPLQDDVMGSAGGIRSTVGDMLRWGDSLLTQLNSAASRETEHPESVDMLFAGHSFLKSSSAVDELYGLGWAKVTLPAQFGKIGFNPGLVDRMPHIGKTTSRGQQVFYHSGAITGYNNCIFLVPQTQTTIIVLTNSIAQGDVADWIGQALLQVVLDETDPVDLIPYAKMAASRWRSQFSDIKRTLDSDAKSGISEPAHAHMVGTYWHTTRALFIKVFQDGDKLRFSFGGKPDQEHTLTHYANDTFCFLPESDDERLSRGLFHYSTSAWLLHFRKNEHGVFTQIAWNIESGAPEAEIFTRDDGGE